MSLFLRLSVTILGGLAMHRFYRPTLIFGDRWGNMMRYSIGTLLLLPFVLLINHALGSVKDDDERLMSSYLLGAGAFGTGVFVGHLADWMGE